MKGRDRMQLGSIGVQTRGYVAGTLASVPSWQDIPSETMADVQLLEETTSRQALDIAREAVSPPARPILRPGQNCWRVASAARASVLIDGAPYFAHLEAALRKAKRSILIVGWDFDGSIRLR